MAEMFGKTFSHTHTSHTLRHVDYGLRVRIIYIYVVATRLRMSSGALQGMN